VDYSAIIQKVRGSIALVVCLDVKNTGMGTGSGFIFKKKGQLITCNHVVREAATIMIKFPDSTDFVAAKVSVRDEEHDIVLMTFDDTSREPIPLGDVDKVAEGMPIVFSGYPFSSQDLTTHQGIISAVIKDATGITSYLIDGTVNSGNSGCPLMDANGKVIGVVNAKRRHRNDLIEKVERLTPGALSLHGIDLVEIYQALSGNIQLGVGHAVPAKYIPEHK